MNKRYQYKKLDALICPQCGEESVNDLGFCYNDACPKFNQRVVIPKDLRQNDPSVAAKFQFVRAWSISFPDGQHIWIAAQWDYVFQIIMYWSASREILARGLYTEVGASPMMAEMIMLKEDFERVETQTNQFAWPPGIPYTPIRQRDPARTQFF